MMAKAAIEVRKSKAEVNRNTGASVIKIVQAHNWPTEETMAIGHKIRIALRAAIKAVAVGEQTHAQIEAQLDKAQYALNRSLARSANPK